MKKQAFTLSEVLIVLSIIGIIAIMTIPSFVKNYKKKVYAAKISQTYAEISEAAKAIMADEHTNKFSLTSGGGKICDEGGSCTTHSDYFLDNYFKTIKRDCKATCMPASYKLPSGENGSVIDEKWSYCIQTIHGAVICPWANENGGTTTNEYGKTTSKANILFWVDTTGSEGPNIDGYDAFILRIQDNGTVEDYDTNPEHCLTHDGEAWPGGCLARIIQDGWKIKY